MDKSGIRLEKIDFSYDSSVFFRNFSAVFPASGVSVILGPSGCGKTSLLNLISGLLQPASGSISIDGKIPYDSRISVIFQEPRLLPWRNIRKNIEIVLKNSFPAAACREKAEHYLGLVGLKDYMEYFPSMLSGGMRQRASMARAFAYPADIILMDEPFQAIDLGMKISLAELFTSLWIDDRRTSIFVTHDINEALMLGDEIFVLSETKPVRIVDQISISEPHSGRSLGSESLIAAHNRLREHLLGRNR